MKYNNKLSDCLKRTLTYGYKSASTNQREFPQQKKPCLEVKTEFQWTTQTFLQKSGTSDQKNDSSSSDSEEEVAKENMGKKKKLSKLEKEKNEEKFLFETERQLADGTHLPQTVDEFDRLVLASPDSSLVWIKYMTFHLQNIEIDLARAVGQRALQVIGFREEQERLNVWTALLNIENLYGTNKTLDEVFKKALRNCDERKVYELLIDILTESNKIEESEQLFQVLLKRYKNDKNIWLKYIIFLMEHQRNEEARNIYKRCIDRLPKREHVDITLKMAQFEFQRGDNERGITLLEDLLANNPKRTDLWSVYTDLMIKHGDEEKARQVLERAISIKGSPRQMKCLFTKYLEFEEKYGNEMLVNAVKQKAMKYLENQTESNS